MIRFIDIGGQINEGAQDFAFYDTVRDRFIGLDEDVVFADREVLVEAWRSTAHPTVDLERLLRLLDAARK